MRDALTLVPLSRRSLNSADAADREPGAPTLCGHGLQADDGATGGGAHSHALLPGWAGDLRDDIVAHAFLVR